MLSWRFALAATLVALSGCAATSDDPAEGGFFNGIRGIGSGGYEGRVAERQQAVATAEIRNAALGAEQSDLAARIDATKRSLAQERFMLLRQRDASPNLDSDTRARVDAVLRAQPGGATDAEQLESLQRLLAETRALSQDLAELAG